MFILNNYLYSLEYLNLNSNKIDKIRFPTTESIVKTTAFFNLRQLHISYNNISEVKVNIYNINKL